MKFGQVERSIEEVALETGMSKIEVDNTLFQISRYFKHPQILDDEKNLIKAYIQTYRAGGQEAARREVARRIDLAKHIRAYKKENKIL